MYVLFFDLLQELFRICAWVKWFISQRPGPVVSRQFHFPLSGNSLEPGCRPLRYRQRLDVDLRFQLLIEDIADDEVRVEQFLTELLLLCNCPTCPCFGLNAVCKCFLGMRE